MGGNYANLLEDIQKNKRNIAISSEAILQAHTSFIANYKNFLSLAEQLEIRVKELEERDCAVKQLESEVLKEKEKFEEREKRCEQWEHCLDVRERDVKTKEAKWAEVEKEMLQMELGKVKVEEKGISKPLKPTEELWTRIIVQKLEVVEKYYQKHGSSFGLSKEDFLAEAHKLGDVTIMAKMLKEGAKFPKLTNFALILTALPPSRFFPTPRVLMGVQPYGLVHASLQIGNYLVDWNDSNLVRPRLLKGKNHLIVLDLKFSGCKIPNYTDTLFTNIAKVIVAWNRSEMKFAERTRNSQHFVNELIQNGLGISPIWPTVFGKYLEGLREDCDNALPHYINESGKRIFFQSHQELDQYVHDHRELTKDQKDLLKAFDRGYMIRWESSGFQDASAAPLHANEACVCHIFGHLFEM